MSEEQGSAPTFIGRVASVRGAVVRVRLQGLPTTLVLVEGESYRVGQLGAFVRIPLGYTNLYAICTQVGADAAPPQPAEEPGPIPAPEANADADSYRWMSVSLFGEAVGGYFDRGVGQYPTVGDEVHLVTSDDLETIYDGGSDSSGEDAVIIGRIASSSGLPARLQLSTLVSRHSSIVGSTGAGKSNLVAVILDALSSGDLPNSRTLAIDAHGEYGSSVGDRGRVIHTGANTPEGAEVLRVPYWALPFDELIELAMGEMQPLALEALRDRVAQMKRDALQYLDEPPPPEAITADTPVPFSIRKLWLELEIEQRASYKKSGQQTEADREDPLDPGDAEALRPPSSPTWRWARLLLTRRGKGSRSPASRFNFMFDRDDPLHPDLDGKTEKDIDTLLAQWVGGEKPVTVLDVSGIPPEVLGPVVGTMLRLVYDALFWAMDLDVGGRKQPLLVVLDEAHRFLPEDGEGPANRVVSRIAKEGRKYGVGLMVVTQRPSDVDSAVLSQCGTMIALRVTNQRDRGAVASTIPDDLGDLSEFLPALRTGEALVLGDALQVPSRIRVDKAVRKPVGEDPPLPAAWLSGDRPDPKLYRAAVKNWRRESTSVTET